MGYFILPDYHGFGYTTEAVARIIAFAFECDSCFCIKTGALKDNIGSWRVMEKLGFEKERELIGVIPHDGQMKDRVEYSLTKEGFTAS